MKEFLFRKNLFLLDLSIAIAYGAALGRFAQLAADSGEHNPDRLMRSMLVGGFSFLLAFALSWIVSFSVSRPLGWLTLVVAGPFLFAISYRTVQVIQGETSISATEFVRNDLLMYLLVVAIPFFVLLILSRIVVLVVLAYAKA